MIAPLDRPMIKFVDVGGKFINKHESMKRTKKATHRGALKAKRQEEAVTNRRRRIQEERRIREDARDAANAEKKRKKTEKREDARSLVLS